MKILSWNINGIRASKISLQKLFDSLNSDVICLQETKVTRDMLDEPVAIVEGYNSYFSFSRKRSGYSGTANFCKDSVTPNLAEEGLSGVLSTSEVGIVGNYGNQSSFIDGELKDLDAEGRTVITQHRIRLEDGREKDLCIINVYCPRFDPDREDRHYFKLRFYALLQTRAEALLKAGCHVIILGDINTTHKDQDHCDPEDEESSKRPSRLWLNQMLWERDRDPTLDSGINCEEFTAATPFTVGGKFVDTYRYFYPDKEGAFTNWCTLTNARATNFGRRLDYILVDIELATQCLKEASIMQEVEGSDHCPISIELNCVCLPSKTCPPMCTKFMPEFSGKQQKLSSFFTKLSKKEIDIVSSGDSVDNSQPPNIKKEVSDVRNGSSKDTKRPGKSQSSTQPLKKQKTELTKSASGSKQANLMSFFNRGSEAKNEKTLVVEQNVNCKQYESLKTSSKYFSSNKSTNGEVSEEHDDKEQANCNDDLSVESTKQSNENLVVPNLETIKQASENKAEAANAWKNLLGGLGPVPLCKGHNEPCVLRMVKKPGPNKGRQFYTCARGEGHKSNPEARCDFFKWIGNKKK